MKKKIVVFLKKGDNKGHVFEGEFDAGVTPSNTLIISEIVPDVDVRSKTGVKAIVKCIYNPSTWAQVSID